jgi:acetyl esterase
MPLSSQDLMLHQIQKNTNLAVVSVEYRLAPEYPWPAALEDCIDVAEWLLTNAQMQVRSLLVGRRLFG